MGKGADPKELLCSTDLPPAFVTYGWCRSAYTVLRSLAAKGVEVHVGDSSPLAMSRYSRYTKSFTRLPDFFCEPEAYVEALGRAVVETGAQVLLPCFEDVEWVIRYRDRLPADLCLALPDLDDWQVAEDKLDYIERVSGAGCPVPRTYRVQSRAELLRLAEEVEYPLVAKVRMGNGARGVTIVERREELERAFFALVNEFDLPTQRWPIIQQHLAGRKFKLDGVFDRGRHVGSLVFEILRCKGAGKFGTSTFRIAVDEPVLQAHAIKALAALNWHGMFNTDWICDAVGNACLIDINGRLSGGVAMPYEAGVDLPWIWYQVALGRDPIGVAAPRFGARTRWLLGDGVALVEHLAAGKFREGLRILKPEPGCANDDFSWRDPLPFVFQGMDYFMKFAKSRGSLRPVTKGMVR
jgi:predicted ATP-grasp superfamily ATP-dependent carboligase